jgi:hypothetical protein
LYQSQRLKAFTKESSLILGKLARLVKENIVLLLLKWDSFV